jgi:hypothetical protein
MENINVAKTQNTFENEMFYLFEKYLENDMLTFSDLKTCHEICSFYEKKINACNLSKLLKCICKKNNFDIDFNNPKNKIIIKFFENSNSRYEKEKHVKMTTEFGDPALQVIFTYQTEEKQNKNENYLFHKFFIDDNLILKKENSSKIVSSINLKYLKILLNSENCQLKITPYQLLYLFLNLFDLENVFDDELSNIEKNSGDYLSNNQIDSDSDISTDSNADSVNDE